MHMSDDAAALHLYQVRAVPSLYLLKDRIMRLLPFAIMASLDLSSRLLTVNWKERSRQEFLFFWVEARWMIVDPLHRPGILKDLELPERMLCSLHLEVLLTNQYETSPSFAKNAIVDYV